MRAISSPCFCAGAVEYSRTLLLRTRRKTRPCRALHPPIAAGFTHGKKFPGLPACRVHDSVERTPAGGAAQSARAFCLRKTKLIMTGEFEFFQRIFTGGAAQSARANSGYAFKMVCRDRRMDRAARLRVNQGDNEGVDSVSMTEWASADLPARLPARRRRRLSSA